MQLRYCPAQPRVGMKWYYYRNNGWKALVIQCIMLVPTGNKNIYQIAYGLYLMLSIFFVSLYVKRDWNNISKLTLGRAIVAQWIYIKCEETIAILCLGIDVLLPKHNWKEIMIYLGYILLRIVANITYKMSARSGEQLMINLLLPTDVKVMYQSNKFHHSIKNGKKSVLNE